MNPNDDPQLLALKVPPHSIEAEQSLLGALLISNDAFEKISWLAEATFYQDSHRRIYRCMAKLIEAGQVADLTTVHAALGDDLDKAGGAAYLGALAQNVPTALNINRYAEIVQERFNLRELVRRSTEIAERALRSNEPSEQQIEAAESSIMALRDVRATGDGWVSVGQALTEYFDWVKDHPNGIETGFRDLDALTGGLLPGNLVLVAGRPSMGKTTLALQFSEHICTSLPGMMFSLEASRREVAGRMIEWHRKRLGQNAASDKIFDLKLFVDETAAITTGAMRARLRRMKRQHGLAIVVVDYLQLVKGHGDTREQEVASVSRELKAIAKEFKVPVVALAQLSREVEKRVEKRPGLSDLRESGALEQDADLIIFPFRPDYYNVGFDGSIAEAELIVAKNRNTGRTGLAKVTFSRDLNRFGDFFPNAMAA